MQTWRDELPGRASKRSLGLHVNTSDIRDEGRERELSTTCAHGVGRSGSRSTLRRA